MFRIFKYGACLNCRLGETQKVLRPFMSEAFQCKDAWNKRLSNHNIQKVNLTDMYNQLDSKFNQDGKVNAIDVDLFTNSINNNSYLEEVENIVHRFRLTSETRNILDSTHHAFIRAFINFGDTSELIRILNDRLNYGIFPDDYCNILMMDQFIKENNFTNAAKIATLQMLQEDFSNAVVKYLSLYSCHRYLLAPSEWSKTVEEKEEKIADDDDDEEVTRVRVRFIRNPYFDDHFDIVDANSLIGKTFKFIGESGSTSALNSYRLLGLTLYKKWQDTILFSNNLVASNGKINSGCINEIENFLSSLLPENEGEKDNEIQDQIHQIKNNLVKLKNNNLVVEKNLLQDTEEKLNLAIENQEKKIINDQCELYDKWEDNREQLLLKEIEEINRLRRIEEVKLKKQDLLKKEEELFFFDIEDKLDLEIESKRIEKSKSLKNRKIVQTEEQEYIPPEIIKRRGQ